MNTLENTVSSLRAWKAQICQQKCWREHCYNTCGRRGPGKKRCVLHNKKHSKTLLPTLLWNS